MSACCCPVAGNPVTASSILSAYAQLTNNVTVATVYPAFTTLLTVPITVPAPGGFLHIHSTVSWALGALSTGAVVRLEIDGAFVRPPGEETGAPGSGGSVSLVSRQSVAAGLRTVTLRLASATAGSVIIPAGTFPDIFGAALLVEARSV